jgi:hypothetical protein
LTRVICNQLGSAEIPKRPVWTVVDSANAQPYAALDFDRPALSDLYFSLNLGLLQLPEYRAAAEAFEQHPELSEGIMVDAGGFLLKPEPTNVTRGLVTNFLWRYLREGERLDWDESRFEETCNELWAELQRKSIVLHTILPLSNLRMGIDALAFGEELTVLPASKEDLERWMNRDRSLGPLSAGPPEWMPQYVDKPGVLHARHSVVGRARSTDLNGAHGHLPGVDAARVTTALRLALNAPISVIFQEQRSEGLMAFGGDGMSWGWSPRPLARVVTLDQGNAAQVIKVWQLLLTSPNIDLLRLPLRRWESSLLRANLKDQLIDAWISLEALLLPDIRDELKHRAGLRLAELLGKDGLSRQAIYKDAQASYGWRSDIVHGSPPKKPASQQELVRTARLTAEYVRETLLKVLYLTDRFVARDLESLLIARETGY